MVNQDLERYLWNACSTGWAFAWQGCMTQRLLPLQKHYSDCDSCECCWGQCILDWHLMPQNRAASVILLFASSFPHFLIPQVSIYWTVSPFKQQAQLLPVIPKDLIPPRVWLFWVTRTATLTVIPQIYVVGGSDTGDISRNIYSHKRNVKKGRVVLDNIFWPQKNIY